MGGGGGGGGGGGIRTKPRASKSLSSSLICLRNGSCSYFRLDKMGSFFTVPQNWEVRFKGCTVYDVEESDVQYSIQDIETQPKASG